MSCVIIIAPRDDFHAEVVAARIGRLGGRAFILPLAELLTSWSLSFSIVKGVASYRITIGDQTIQDHEISGLWWRRPVAGPSRPEAGSEAFAKRETASLIQGLLYSLDQKVMNPLAAERVARNKLRQLAEAVSVGFKVPDTLVSSDPETAVAFRRANASHTIFKLLTFAPERKLIETRIFSEDCDPHLAAIRVAPVLFQEKIEKTAEVRATVVDGQCFAVECVTEVGNLDWRMDPNLQYRPYTLTPKMKTMLVDLHRNLGLRYGAVDFAVTATDECVFFETNVSGQFLFCEIDAGEPISLAIAQALMQGEAPNRAPVPARLT